MGENALVFRRHRYFGVKYYDVYSLQMVQPNTHTHTCIKQIRQNVSNCEMQLVGTFFNVLCVVMHVFEMIINIK